MKPQFEALLLAAVEAGFAAWPRRAPGAAQLRAARIISHRGERDNGAAENTHAAFDPLRGSGVFGIEFDVRWTADLVPVVVHDADLARVFGDPVRVRDLTAAALAARQPQVPRLDEFVRRYTGEFFLMCELKEEPYPEPALQAQRLLAALQPALAADRCCLMALQPALLDALPGLPRAHTLGIARWNVAAIGAEALAAGRGGIGAQYALLGAAGLRAHHAAGQRVGTGFPRTRSVLWREVARGVDWIFSDQALRLQRWLDEARARAAP